MKHIICMFLLLAASCAFGESGPWVEQLTLNDAVRQALQGNHQYRSLLNSVQVAELDYEQARSAFKTKLKSSLNSDARSGAEVGSSYRLGLSKQNESGSAFGVGLINSTFGDDSLSELRFSYTLPFFQNPIKSGKFQSDRAELDFRHRERMASIGAEELVLQVVQSYYDVALAINQMAVSDGEFLVAKRLEHATRIRARTGKSSDLDLQWASLRVAQAQQARRVSELQKIKAENALKLLLGVDIETLIEIDREIPPVEDPDLLIMSAQAVEAIAMERRAELIGLGEDLDLARRKVRSSSQKRVPNFDVSLQYSLLGDGDGFSDSLSFNDTRFGVGVSMDFDLMGSPNQEYRRLTLFYDDKRRAYEQLEADIRADVRDAVFAMQDSAGQLALARESVRLSEQQFRLTELKYRGGSASTLEVLEAQQEQSDTRHRELAARVRFLQSTYRVQMVSGTLLERWAGEIEGVMP